MCCVGTICFLQINLLHVAFPPFFFSEQARSANFNVCMCVCVFVFILLSHSSQYDFLYISNTFKDALLHVSLSVSRVCLEPCISVSQSHMVNLSDVFPTFLVFTCVWLKVVRSFLLSLCYLYLSLFGLISKLCVSLLDFIGLLPTFILHPHCITLEVFVFLPLPSSPH